MAFRKARALAKIFSFSAMRISPALLSVWAEACFFFADGRRCRRRRFLFRGRLLLGLLVAESAWVSVWREVL